jgi:hypothetical protein
MDKDIKQQFLNGTHPERLAMLLAFAVNLTILIRGEYQESTAKGRALNETLHRIVSQTLAMLVKSQRKYPEDGFIDGLLVGAEDKGLLPILEQAFAQRESMASKDVNAGAERHRD